MLIWAIWISSRYLVVVTVLYLRGEPYGSWFFGSTNLHHYTDIIAASINEDNYFNNLLGNDIAKIAKDLRDAHGKDAETGDRTTPVDDMLDTFEELKTGGSSTHAQMVMYSKLLKINFTKMDPYEFKTFTDILNRYSDLCKPVKGNGRGRKKK